MSSVERDRAHNPHLPMPSLPPIIHLPGASMAGNQILNERLTTKIYEMICTRVLLSGVDVAVLKYCGSTLQIKYNLRFTVREIMCIQQMFTCQYIDQHVL